MGMNGGPVYARACAEALPLLFTFINASDSRSIENNTATENAISAVTKIFKYNNSYVDNLDKVKGIFFI
jgi:ABC-type phosphate transport system permease subunit